MGAHRASRGFAIWTAMAVLAAGEARAHDFWIEPASYAPAVGAVIPIRLRVGEHFAGEPFVRKPDRIEWFAAVGPKGESPVPGEAGAEPAGSLSIDTPGIHVIGYRSRQSFIELSASQFDQYLKEEGLGRILELRAAHGDKSGKARELYSRSAKSLVSAGAAKAGGHDRVLGFPLELVPEINPYSLDGRGALPIRLLFRGSPLAGAQVQAISHQDPRVVVTVLTDAGGRATLRLDRPGAWLVKTIHMYELTDRSKADWESLWATLTFEVPAGASSR
jgi:uncharacterized GH25 family protein